MLGITLAKEQPVALLALGNPSLEQAAQPCQAGTIAEENHWHRFGRQMKTAVAAHAQADRRADCGMFGKPARTDAQAAISMPLLTYDQLQQTVLRDRGNGVFAHVQRDQCVHQCLGVHAHKMAAIFRQLSASQGLSQSFLQAIELHRSVSRQPQPLQEVLNRPARLPRHHFHQITGLPQAVGVRRAEPQQVHPRATAAGVEQLALSQGPVVVTRRLPVGIRRASGQLAKLLLPLMQGLGIAAVHLHRAEQRLGTALAQPVLDPRGKTAKVRVLTIAQCQHRVLEAVQSQRLAEDLAFKAPRAIRRFAIAKGAHHKQRVAGLL